MAMSIREKLAKAMGRSSDEIIEAPYVRVSINAGFLTDITTGKYVRSIITDDNGNRLWALNGGVAGSTGFIGRTNLGKTTILNAMMLSAFSRVHMAIPTRMRSNDTEGTYDYGRLATYAKKFIGFKDVDVFNSGIWKVTDKGTMATDEFFEEIKKSMALKIKELRNIQVKTVFEFKDSGKPFTMPMPEVTSIDSLSESDDARSSKALDNTSIGSLDGQTLFMMQGLARTRLMLSVPKMANITANYLFLSGHVGDTIDMGGGPMKAAKAKDLAHMTQDDRMKGLPQAFRRLMMNIWQVTYSKPLSNPKTRFSEYPLNPDDNKAINTDLMLTTMKLVRSKVAKAGPVVKLVVSQEFGVLPSLTEFHNIRTKKFGFNGSLQNYQLCIYPDVTLSRTTVRGKLDTDPKLERAVNILSEIAQLYEHDRTISKDYMVDPHDLYTDLIKLGYDWDKILESRGWTVPENDLVDIPWLPTKNLLWMRTGEIVLKEFMRSDKDGK